MSPEFSLKNKEKLKEKKSNLYHIAIIMDGNRRWADKKGKNRIFGHQEGFKAVKKAVRFAILKKLKILTLYAFSSENRNRSLSEIASLMELFLFALNSEKKNLNQYDIKLKVIGDITYFNKKLQCKINQVENKTFNNKGLILNIAANYSGRWDITQSVRKISNKIQKGLLRIDEIQEDIISQNLSTNKLLPVDLVIRTGGEKRISNFLLWEIAYSELYFTDVLWPDFNENIFQDAIDSFMSRERRFGGLKF